MAGTLEASQRFAKARATLSSAIERLHSEDDRSSEAAVLRNLLYGLNRISDFLNCLDHWEQQPQAERRPLLRMSISAGGADFVRMRRILERENLLDGTDNLGKQEIAALLRTAERGETAARLLSKEYSGDAEKTTRALRLGRAAFDSALRRFWSNFEALPPGGVTEGHG